MVRLLMATAVLATVVAGGLAGAAWAQDVAAGEKSFAKCRSCHQVGETAKNGVGPVMNGLFGRVAGTIPGYTYSPQNKASGITWDVPVFAEYIRDPKAKIPGTKMVFPGIKNDKEIADLTAYLQQFDATGKKTGS